MTGKNEVKNKNYDCSSKACWMDACDSCLSDCLSFHSVQDNRQVKSQHLCAF